MIGDLFELLAAGVSQKPIVFLPFWILIGMFLGSFYRALATRVIYYFYGPGRKQKDRWKRMLTRPSFCMSCETPLGVVELIPAVGYFLNRGRCRHCGSPIGFGTLMAELYPGILLPLLLLSQRSLPSSLFLVAMAGHLYISIETDRNFFQLDHENAVFLFLFGALSVIFSEGNSPGQIPLHFAVAAGVFLFFFLFRLLAGVDRFGAGDVILVSLLSLPLSFLWFLVWIQLASTLAILSAVAGKKGLRDPIPFGVYLSSGFLGILVLRALQEILWPTFTPYLGG